MDEPRVNLAHNVRVLRQARGLTLEGLAAASGVARASLARIEAGRVDPRLATLSSLATALHVPLPELFRERSVDAVRVVRRGEGALVEQNVQARMLERVFGLALGELVVAVFPADQRRSADPHGPGVIEHLYVVEGKLEAGPTAEPVLLESGDYLRFPADSSHTYLALDKPATAVVLLSYPTTPERTG
jgi:transcriptional regulator with XRE-family HTH domain